MDLKALMEKRDALQAELFTVADQIIKAAESQRQEMVALLREVTATKRASYKSDKRGSYARSAEHCAQRSAQMKARWAAAKEKAAKED